MKITPLPIWHGQNHQSLGFRFGNICYISDVSEIPEETYPLLKDCEILILDALRPYRSTSTHFGLPRALEEVRKIQPTRTLFTGGSLDIDGLGVQVDWYFSTIWSTSMFLKATRSRTETKREKSASTWI